MKSRLIPLAALLMVLPLAATAQVETAPFTLNEVPVGGWRSYLSHFNGQNIQWRNNEVFMTTDVGFVRYDLSTQKIDRFSRLNGLNGTNSVCFRYDAATDLFFIGYADGTVDYFQTTDHILTIRDIAINRNFLDKRINDVEVADGLAYIATNFGVVVYDLAAQETRFTYTFITLANVEPRVTSVAVYQDSLFVGLENGLYAGVLDGRNLADGANWAQTALNIIPSGVGVQRLAYDASNLYAQLSDTLLVHKPASSPYRLLTPDSLPFRADFRDLSGKGERVNLQYGALLYDFVDGRATKGVDTEFGRSPHYAPNADHYAFWANDSSLHVVSSSGQRLTPLQNENPPFNTIWDLTLLEDNLYIGTSLFQGQEFPTFQQNGIMRLNTATGEWFTPRPGGGIIPEGIYDMGVVAPSPVSGDVYIGTWSLGIVHLSDTDFVAIYDGTNSPIKGVTPPNSQGIYENIRIPGVEVDQTGHLWASVHFPDGSDDILVVRSPEGEFATLSTGDDANNLSYGLHIGPFSQKWIPLEEGGVYVLNDNNTPLDVTDDQSRLYRTGEGNGNLEDNRVRAITTDLNGTIWMGTGAGVSVVFNPAGAQTPGASSDAGCPLVEGFCLLNEQAITTIAVDGANRKWIGTASSGVFLFSADGTEAIAQFTVQNSPLISNGIVDIAIDPKSGEVFVATDRGLMSYRGEATLPDPTDCNLSVFPNPVPPNHIGPIVVRGLQQNAVVRVLTPTGQLVRELQQQGGQATWDGRDIRQNEVASGVYVIQAVNLAGDVDCSAKVAFFLQP